MKNKNHNLDRYSIFNKILSSFLMIAMFFAMACEKETVNIESNKGYQVPQELLRNVSQENGLLKFESQEDFEKTIELLEKECKKWQDQFFLTYKNLDDNELNKKIIELNFNFDLPLIYFENALNFNSLRKKVDKEIEIWLNNEELDMEKNPNNQYIVDDPYLRTLVNEKSEIMIGNSIYKIFESGLVYEINNGDFSELEKIEKLKGDDDFYFADNVIIHNAEYLNKASTCQANEDISDVIYYTTNRKVEVRVVLRNFTFWHNAHATTQSYYKPGSSWKKYSTSVKAQVYGQVSPFNTCTNMQNFDSGQESETNWEVEARSPFGATTHTKSGYIHSWHYCDGWSGYLDLTW